MRRVRVQAKETAHLFFTRIAFVHACVVGAKRSKQGFVVAEKGSGVRQPLVPDDDDPAGGLEDTKKFAAGGVLVEPVEGLAGGHEVDACVIERGGFGGAVDAGEAVVRGEIFFARQAHRFVGLDAEDAIAVFQEEFAQESRCPSRCRR